MLSISSGSLQNLHNSYSYSFTENLPNPRKAIYAISRWLLRADLRNNQPDVLEIVKNDTFFLQRILYNTFVLRRLGEVVRTFYPTIFFFGLVPTEWTKIETKHSRMHFQRLMYSKIKIAM